MDLEITDKYVADLETVKGKKVVQKVRFLPNHRYNFVIKANRQLEQAGVVLESVSECMALKCSISAETCKIK